MHPLSDKDLDRLSREAADQFDVEQNTSGWDKLEQKLSKHMPEKGRKERRRFLFFIWLFALLSGGGLLWMLTGTTPQLITLKEGSSKPTLSNSEKKTASSPLSETQAPAVTRDKTAMPDPALTESATTPEKRLSTTVDEHEVTNTDNETASSSAPRSQQATSRLNPPTRQSIGRDAGKIDRSGQTSQQKPPSNNSGDREDIAKNNKRAPIDQQRETEEITHAPQSPSPAANSDQNKSGQEKVDKEKPSIENSKEINSNKKETTQSTSNKKTSIPKTGGGFNKGLTLGLVGAPDMSTVKFTNTDKVGYNVGLQIGYRFSQRWSANTGLLYTRKNYTAKGRDFHPPKGTWIDNVQLESVEGYCEMLDIPVNVRYDLTSGNRHRFFLSTGLSSYIMKNEDYHYYYQYTNGTPGYRHRSGSSSEKHWASILNISAGFEKKIGKRFSIQAEPYFKLPLAGVGFGNMKLNSYGIYFSTRIDAKRGR